MATVDIQKFADIPHLDLAHLDGRMISSLTFYDDEKWHMWVPAGDQLIKIQAWPAEAFYFAKEEADPNDIAFHFLDLLSQRACYPEVKHALLGIHDDIFNLSASLVKIEHLHATHDAARHGCTRMVSSEVEYLFLVCRSIFDLLQEIALELWDLVKVTEQRVVKRPLKKLQRYDTL